MCLAYEGRRRAGIYEAGLRVDITISEV